MSTLERSIDAWYDEDPKRKEQFDRIIQGKAGFSLREIDHFVTNMTVRKPVIFINPRNGKIIDVNSDYRDVLRCYHKAGFDSFKRGGGLEFKQKNFFRWALENGIVDYVASHVREIEADMLEIKKQPPPVKRQRIATSNFTIVKQSKELVVPTYANIVW